LWASSGKSTTTNQSPINTNPVLHNSHGSCLPRPGGGHGFPISHPPDEGSGEYGDGNLLNTDFSVPSQGSTQPTLENVPHAHQHNQENAHQHTQNNNHSQASGNIEPHSQIEAPPPQHPNPTQENSSIPSENPHNRENSSKKKIRKNTRASLKIASINMRGHGPSGSNNPDNKWNHINQLVKENRIGVLAIQEAHLTQGYVDDIHRLFGKRLQIHFSQGTNPNAQGVAIVLNREMTNIHNIKQQDIVPGRAMLLTLPWHLDKTLTILNIYAPNGHSENQLFWETLQGMWTNLNLPPPDLMLGDFNLVEDALDRLPSHGDPPPAVNALDSL
jgi:hypothetical protein